MTSKKKEVVFKKVEEKKPKESSSAKPTLNQLFTDERNYVKIQHSPPFKLKHKSEKDFGTESTKIINTSLIKTPKPPQSSSESEDSSDSDEVSKAPPKNLNKTPKLNLNKSDNSFSSNAKSNVNFRIVNPKEAGMKLHIPVLYNYYCFMID